MDNTITPASPEFNVKDAVTFYKKMNSIRKELCEKGILPKGAHNDYDNYDYFSEAQYKELFTEFFSKHGIEIFFDEVDRGSFDGTEKQPFGRYVTLACILIDSETGFTLITHHTGEGLDRGDKAIYKATTGAIKKFLSSTFLVATKDDPEREDEKKPSKKITSTSKTGGITKGQETMIKSLFKDKKEQLKELMAPYNKKKLEELTIAEASKIIELKKGENNNE